MAEDLPHGPGGPQGSGQWSHSGEENWGGLKNQEGLPRREGGRGVRARGGGEPQCLQSGGEIVRFI